MHRYKHASHYNACNQSDVHWQSSVLLCGSAYDKSIYCVLPIQNIISQTNLVDERL